MDQLIFIKKKKRPSTEATHIRVDKRQYEKIKDLSEEAGLTVYDMTNELLRFAISNVVVEEE